MPGKKYKRRTLTFLIWKTIYEEWRIWLGIVILLLIVFLFSDQIAAWLERSTFIKVLDSLSKLGLLVAAIAFLREIPKWEERAEEEARRRQLEYWKAIDAARTTQRSKDGRLYSTSLKIDLESLAAEKNAYGEPIKLTNVSAHEAKLQELNLEYAHLHVCGFHEADLSGANFCNTRLEVVDFFRARIFGSDFSNSLFIDVAFTHALYDQETKFPNDFDPQKAGACLIAPGVDLQQANLVNALLWDANLEGANLQGADLCGASIGGMRNNWQRTNLQNANLQGARAPHIDLRLANLSKANLQGAKLDKAKLDGANLQGADLRGVEFITVSQIKTSNFWDEAIYDDDFRQELGLLS
jgi:uncharacterized protein YjbI with pentapeptide repeats